MPPETVQGAVVVDGYGARWRFVRFGCATGASYCDKRQPITVVILDRFGQPKTGSMTQCLDGVDVVVEPDEFDAIAETLSPKEQRGRKPKP